MAPADTFAAMETFSPLQAAAQYPFPPALSFSSLSTRRASISNANNYKNQTMSVASAQLCCSFRLLCSTLLFPLGNYPFPVVVIILQHAADPVIHTSHFHLQPAVVCLRLPAVLYITPTPNAWCRGQRDRPLSTEWRWREREGEEIGKDGKGKQRKMNAPSINTHPSTHVCTYSVLFASLVKTRVLGKICKW